MTRFPPLPRPLARWSAGDVQYALRPLPGGDALLTAVGPGLRIRVAEPELDDATVAEWVTLTDMARTRRAEDLFRTGARAAS